MKATGCPLIQEREGLQEAADILFGTEPPYIEEDLAVIGPAQADAGRSSPILIGIEDTGVDAEFECLDIF